MITTNLWFDGNAREAAEFYATVFPNSFVNPVYGDPAFEMTVTFTLDGTNFIGLNGGPHFKFNEAVSFVISCKDQAEVDYYWNALTANGGEPGQCGWLKDKFGLSWQVIPTDLGKYLGGSDPAGASRAMQAMLGMGKLDIDGLKHAYEG
jgi:predicted 3-demethylubiquinone-9 3-methyltransferase (glyoxalase superfamily)